MALLVNYEGLTFWGAQFKAEERNEADQLGHVLMAVGLSEISKKTISELLFRVRFLDFTWGSSFFKNDPSNEELIQLFKKHIGLKIEITNRGIKNLNTRRRFMVNQLDNIEDRVLRKIEGVN
tara:strand:+ start:217 stop:582 length:366 start_codon:yes stop_codon:yes gene_type:complete